MNGEKFNIFDCKYAIEHGNEYGKIICCNFCPESLTCDYSCEDMAQICGRAVDTPLAEATKKSAELIAMETAIPTAIQTITSITVEKKRLEEQEKQLKRELLEAMERNNIKTFENQFVKFAYVEPTTRTAIDSAKLKRERPEIVKEFSRISNVSASVRITVKE